MPRPDAGCQADDVRPGPGVGEQHFGIGTIERVSDAVLGPLSEGIVAVRGHGTMICLQNRRERFPDERVRCCPRQTRTKE